jgi:hypothetical protein
MFTNDMIGPVAPGLGSAVMIASSMRREPPPVTLAAGEQRGAPHNQRRPGGKSLRDMRSWGAAAGGSCGAPLVPAGSTPAVQYSACSTGRHLARLRYQPIGRLTATSSTQQQQLQRHGAARLDRLDVAAAAVAQLLGSCRVSEAALAPRLQLGRSAVWDGVGAGAWHPHDAGCGWRQRLHGSPVVGGCLPASTAPCPRWRDPPTAQEGPPTLPLFLLGKGRLLPAIWYVAWPWHGVGEAALACCWWLQWPGGAQ